MGTEAKIEKERSYGKCAANQVIMRINAGGVSLEVRTASKGVPRNWARIEVKAQEG